MASAQRATGDLTHIRAIVFREGGLYVAQCLELDISAQASDIDAVLDRLELTIEAERAMSLDKGGEEFDGICPAPNYFHELWEKRSVTLDRVNVPVGTRKLQAALAKAA